MDISHLYNDSFLGSPTTALDVKERLQTREINAREDRTFEQWVKIFQRGQDLCQRNMAWEKWQAHRSLYTIWERTPRLEKSLAAEKARVASLEKSIFSRVNSEKPNRISSRNLVSDKLKTRPTVLASGTACPQGDVPTIGEENKPRVKLKDRERPLNTDFRLQSYLHRQADFVRRSQHVVRSLARLNWRQQKRRRDHEKLREELFRLSQPVIVRARVVLKGHPELDATQYLNALENYLLPSESTPSPRKQADTLSEDEAQKESDADSVPTSRIETNSLRGNHYAVLPPVSTASNGDAAGDTAEATKDDDFSSNNRSTKRIALKNKLKVGGNPEDSTARSISESRAEPKERMQHLKATHGLQTSENTQRASRNTGRRFLLTSLKTANVVRRETVAGKQGINNSAIFTNNSKDASSFSNDKSNSKSRNNGKKSIIVIEKMKTVDKDVCTTERGIDNTESVIRTRNAAAKDRNKLNRSNNCGKEHHNESSNLVNCDGPVLNNRRYDASARSYSTGCIVDKRSNACNYVALIIDKGSGTSNCGTIVVSDKRSGTSNCGTIATSDRRSDVSNCGTNVISDKRSGTSNCGIIVVSDTRRGTIVVTDRRRDDTCNSSITQIKNKRTNISNPSSSWISDKRGDNTDDSFRRINASRNDTFTDYENTNKRYTPSHSVTNYQRDITSDSKTSTSEALNHTQGSFPCVNMIGTDTFGRIGDTAEISETKDNTTTQTRNRRVRDVYNNSNLDRIHKTVKTIETNKDSNTSINNGVNNVKDANSKSNNVYNTTDSIAASQAGPNNTDNNENTKHANDNRRSYSVRGDNNTQRLPRKNISSNNHDSKCTDDVVKESGMDEPAKAKTNNTCNNACNNTCNNNTFKHTDTSANSTYNNTYNSTSINANNTCNNTFKHTGTIANNTCNSTNINTNNTHNSTNINTNNTCSDTYNNTPVVCEYNNNHSPANNGDTNSTAVKSNSTNNSVSTLDAPRKNAINIKPSKNTTRHGGKNLFIDNKQRDNAKKTTLHEDDKNESYGMCNTEPVPRQRRIKNANRERARGSSVLAARKSSNIFAPSGGVSQAIPEEDEYMYAH